MGKPSDAKSRIPRGTKGVSSPYSSGGGGVTLERRVIARYLALLLTGHGARELGTGRQVLSVAFQQAPAHPVDDVVITASREGEADPGLVLAIGIRRAPIISATNTDTKKLFADFLNELAAAPQDGPEHRLGLAVAGQQPRPGQLQQLAVLARNQPDSDRFEGLVQTSGKINNRLREQLDTVKELVRLALAASGSEPDEALVRQRTWEMLSCLHVLMPRVEEPDTLDWDSTLQLLMPIARGNTPAAAGSLLDHLEVLAGQYGPTAAVIDRRLLRRDVDFLLESDVTRRAQAGTAPSLPQIQSTTTLPGRERNSSNPPGMDGANSTALLRYVVPVGKPIPLDRDGFLDPSPRAGGQAAIRQVEGLIGSPNLFVLLGAGGAGKSETSRALAHAEDARWLDLSLATPEQLADQVAQAAEERSALYLDTVELYRAREPAPFSRLLEAIRTALDHRVRLRFSCRTAAWDQTFETAIKSGAVPVEVMALAPLDRAAAEVIVSQSREGMDGPGFVRALADARRGRLSASPQRLLIAAEYWQRERRLPDSDRAAIEYEITAFLKETRRDRPAPLPLDRAEAIARRLGAFAALTGARTFTLEPTITSAVCVDELPSDPEPDAPLERILPEHVRHVLGTPLFEQVAPGVLAFRHQQYAEFLAARYLHGRGTGARQKLALLGIQPDGMLPGLNAGVAAWTLALDPELIRRVVPGNAVTLLRSDIEITSEQVRAAIVDDLLAQAHQGERGADWGLDLSRAVHPGLGMQLKARLTSGSVPDLVAWWTARLAIAGHCTELAQPLAQLAGQRERSASARRSAVQAVARLDQEAALASLAGLAPVGCEEDPDCELSGALIDALYPRVLSARQMLPLLGRQPQTQNLLGGHLAALRRLPERVATDDLPIFLGWLGEQTRDLGLNAPIDEVYLGLVRRGWEHTDDEAIRDALAQMLIDCPQSARWLLHQHQSDPTPWSQASYESRRPLITAIAERIDEQSSYKLLELRLVGPHDALDLLDDLPGMSEPAAQTLTPYTQMWAHDPAVAQRLKDLDPTHPAFEATAQLRTAPSAPSQRQKPETDKESERRRQTERLDEQLDVLDLAIEQARADLGSWWKAAGALDVDQAPRRDRCGYDLTSREGWHRLTDADQEWFLDRGVAYVNALAPVAASDEPAEKSANCLPYQAGLWLLTTVLRHAAAKSAALTSQAWERLAPAVVLTRDGGLEADAQARVELLREMPVSARRVAAAAALEHLDRLHASGRFAFFHEGYAELSADIGPQIAARLEQQKYTGVLASQLLGLLAFHAPGTIGALCRTMAQRPEAALHAQARAVLAQIDPNWIIDNLGTAKPNLETDAEILDDLELTKASHAQLATLAGVLLDAYPFADDPAVSEYYKLEGKPTYKLRELRATALRELVARGRAQTLAALRPGRPEPDTSILLRFERAARERQADLAPLNITPPTLLKLLHQGDRRLVRHDADLRDVMIEELGRLQDRITYGAAQFLWDGTQRPKVEDAISDWVAQELVARFDRGLTVDREVQIRRRSDHGVGTRADLTATTPTGAGTMARVIAEAKRIDNSGLETSLLNQLHRQYLQPTNLRYGIYLVYWVQPDQRPARWPKKHPTIDGLFRYLTEQARQTPDEVEITPYVLDISRPA